MIEHSIPPSSLARLSGFEQRLLTSISHRHGAMVNDLATFVAIPTGRAPHPAAVEGLERVRSLMRARLEALGATSQLVAGCPRPGWLDGPNHFRVASAKHSACPPPTLICRKALFSSELRPVLLSGHLDTVHDPSPDAPFSRLSVASDRATATGPGVVDMKGGLVIALHALEALAETGLELPFGFILNCDEETGSFHSDDTLRAEAARSEYAAALALEPANGPTGLVTARGGSGQFLLTASGIAAHVGRDFASGRSATDALARAIIAVHALTDADRGRIVNISTLFCDQPANQVSDFAAAWGNLRYPTQQDGEALRDALAALHSDRIVTDVRLIRPAKPATPANIVLSEMVRSIAAEINQSITFTVTAGVCDGNNLQAGRPTLPVLDTLGVRGGGLHTPDEWIDLRSLTERTQLLALLLSRLSRSVPA